MANRVVILGGGTAGTLLANRLAQVKARGRELEITVIDRDDDHIYQPGLLFVPFGMSKPSKLIRPRHAQLRDSIEYIQTEIDHVEHARNEVVLADGKTIGYDVLVIATGAVPAPEEVEGLTGSGWGKRAFTFYNMAGATGLAQALERFNSGRLVVNLVDMPIKCPVAPLEFCFLADYYLTKRGVRDQVEISYVTPVDAAFTKPIAARHLGSLLGDKHVKLETEFATGSVDTEAGTLTSWDERTMEFDLLVSIPAHNGARALAESPDLTDDLGFVKVDRATLQSTAAENVLAIGDATNVPTSKAGSVAHFEGETVTRNVGNLLAGRPLEASFDGHTNCFIETGFGKALLIDFSYDVEPLPGKFPEPHVGPLKLLGESTLNHMGKLSFAEFYWHMLLPGRDVRGINSRFSLAGKDTSQLEVKEVA